MYLVKSFSKVNHFSLSVSVCSSSNTINSYSKGGIHGTVVACWTAGPQVERSILHQGYDQYKYSSEPRLLPVQHSLTSAESWPITSLIHLFILNFNLESYSPPNPYQYSLERPSAPLVRHLRLKDTQDNNVDKVNVSFLIPL